MKNNPPPSPRNKGIIYGMYFAILSIPIKTYSLKHSFFYFSNDSQLFEPTEKNNTDWILTKGYISIKSYHYTLFITALNE